MEEKDIKVLADAISSAVSAAVNPIMEQMKKFHADNNQQKEDPKKEDPSQETELSDEELAKLSNEDRFAYNMRKACENYAANAKIEGKDLNAFTKQIHHPKAPNNQLGGKEI